MNQITSIPPASLNSSTGWNLLYDSFPNIRNFNLEYTAVSNHATLEKVQPNDKRLIIAYAIGLLLGRKLAIPTAPVEGSYYINNHAEFSIKLISFLNERIVFDTAIARNFANLIWSLRYRAVYPDVHFQALSSYGFFDTVFDCHLLLDPPTYEFVNQWKTQIFTVANHLTDLLES